MLSSYVIFAQHPRRPLSSFVSMPPTRPEQTRGISHSPCPILLPADHCPLSTIALSPLAATLMEPPVSVANKRLTEWLNPLDATLTKNRGVGAFFPFRNSSTLTRPSIHVFSFHALTNCKFYNPFVLMVFHLMGGCIPRAPSSAASTGAALISRTRSGSAGTSSFVNPLVWMVSCR